MTNQFLKMLTYADEATAGPTEPCVERPEPAHVQGAFGGGEEGAAGEAAGRPRKQPCSFRDKP